MFKKILPVIFFILCSTTFCFNGWQGIKNEKFTIFYKAEREYAAKELMEQLNEVTPVAEKTTGNSLKRVYFVIDDFGSVVNGYADPTHSDSIHIFTYSPDSNELAMSENWYKTVGVHEYTHMLQMKNCSGVPKIIKSLYGNFYFPNTFVPSWVLEGITVYTESNFSKYSGRLNDGYFDAYLMARLQEGKKLKIENVSEFPLEFPYGSYYLYGGLFFRYISQTYGEEKFGEFFNEYGSSVTSYVSPLLPFAGLDRICKKVYGKSFTSLWKEWQEFETKKASSFNQDGEKISSFNDYASGCAVYDGKIYYTRLYKNFTSASTSDIKSEIWTKDITTNKEDILFESTSEIFPTLTFKENALYFATSNYRVGFKNSSNNGIGVDKRVFKIDINSKKVSEVFKDTFRCFTVSSSGEIIYSVDKKECFGSEIYKFSPIKNSKEKICDSKMLINEVVEYNGKIYVSSKSKSANFGIFEFTLEDSSFKQIADTPYLEGHISVYDNKLFFISNNNSQYRSYYYDFASSEIFSVTKSGYSIYPAYCKENNALYYIGIGSNGNCLYKKEFAPVKTVFDSYAQNESSISDFTDLKYKKAGYEENLIHLLTPTGRDFGYSTNNKKRNWYISLSGSDKISDIPSYTLNLKYNEGDSKDKFKFDFTLRNNLMLPIKNSLTIDNDSFKTLFLYPAVLNSKPGVQSVSCGLLIQSDYDFKRRAISPNISMGINYPSAFVNIYAEAPFEGKEFSDSSKNRLGVISSLKMRKSFKNSFIQGDIQSVYNPDFALTDNDSVNDVRGYSDELNSSDKLFASLNYSYNILRIRTGIWNPNAYIGDMSINLFADSSFERKNIDNRQLSGGIEVSTLTGFAFNAICLFPTVRISFPENKAPVYDFSLSTNF